MLLCTTCTIVLLSIGDDEGMLCHPCKVAVMPGSGSFVVCDIPWRKPRMQLFNSKGDFLMKFDIGLANCKEHPIVGLAIAPRGNNKYPLCWATLSIP